MLMHPEVFDFLIRFGLPIAGASFGVAWIGVRFCTWLSFKYGVLDHPSIQNGKEQRAPMPLLGGTGTLVALVLVCAYAAIGFPGMWWLGKWVVSVPSARLLLGLLFALIWLAIGGFLDDRHNQPWWAQLVWAMVATGIVFATGVRMQGVTNIATGALITLPVWIGFGMTVVWFWASMFTTKILDGVDGLVGGITMSSALVIFGLTMTERWWQPGVGVFALAVAAGYGAFLLYNWSPATTYLGQAGSVAAGFLLAWLSIVSGSKLLTLFMVLLLPMLDLGWAIVRRWYTAGTYKAVLRRDVGHLHHVLKRRGWSASRIAATYLFAGLLPGIVSVFLSPQEKVLMVIVTMVILGFGMFFVYRADERARLMSGA